MERAVQNNIEFFTSLSVCMILYNTLNNGMRNKNLNYIICRPTPFTPTSNVITTSNVSSLKNSPHIYLVIPSPNFQTFKSKGRQ